MAPAADSGASWLTAADVRLLSDIGFVASCSRQTQCAVQIFQALTLVRPLRAFPYVGLGLAYLNARQAPAALAALALGRQVLGGWPPPHGPEHAEELALLRVFEGIAAHADQRRAEGFQLLRQALHTAPPEGPAARLARSVLGLGADEPDLAASVIPTPGQPA